MPCYFVASLEDLKGNMATTEAVGINLKKAGSDPPLSKLRCGVSGLEMMIY